MKTKYLLLLSLALLSRSLPAQQELLCIYQQIEDIPVLFIDPDGKVKFTLPAGHIPVFLTDTEYGPLEPGLITFGNGICIVRNRNQYYWVDRTGKTIQEHGERYSKMFVFSEGIC